MNRATFNTTVSDLNTRLLWLNSRQILTAPDKGHVTQAKLLDLEGRFQSLMGHFVHENPVLKPCLASRWEPGTEPGMWNYIGEVNIGLIPDCFRYWIQGWNSNRDYTPMQHIAPRVWRTEPKHGVLPDWDASLADIRTGLNHLNYLPYTTWKRDSYSRTEVGSGFFTFGGGEIQEDTHTTQEGTGCAITLGEVAEMWCPSMTPQTSEENYIRGGYSTLTMKNPHPYTIEVTFLVTITPTGGGGHYYVPGCGECTTEYTIPSLISGNTFKSPNDYVPEFENSIRNARYRTETFTLAPRSQRSYGPTRLNDMGAPEYCRLEWETAQSLGTVRGGYECQGGRTISILAYYHPLTERN